MGTSKIKSKKKISGGSLAAIIISVLILIGLVISIIASTGAFMRMKKGADSDNFKVNGSMMEYFLNSYYSNWYSQYYYYIAAGYINFDPSKSLKEQKISDSMTYFDYFKEMVTNQVTTMLKYCEAAKADTSINFSELEENGKKLADQTINTLKESAKSSNTSLSYQISSKYGKNVSEKDIRKAITLVSIASDYANMIQERFSDSVTKDEMNKYFSEHLDKFITAKYFVYSIDSSWAVPTVDPSDYEGGEDSQEYKDAVEKAKEETKKKNEEQKLKDREFLDKLAAAKDADEFKKLILEREFDGAFSNAYEAAVKSFADADKPSSETLDNFKKEIKDKVIEAALNDETTIDLEHDHSDDEEISKWEEASHDLPKAVISTLSSKLTSAEKSSTYALKTDLDKFLFGGIKKAFGIDYTDDEDKDGTSAKAGESKIVDEIKNEEVSSYTLTINYVTDEAARHDEVVRNVGHILIKTSSHKGTDGEKDAKTLAEEIYNELLKSATDDGELKIISKDAFEAVAKEKNEDSNVFYNDVKKGQMVESFEKWLFSAEKEGQLGLVESDYGWHIMYYGGENENGKMGWEMDAQSYVANDKVDNWFNNLPYTINVNEKIFNSLMK